MIELRSLTKRYGSFTAVNAVDLDVPRGELFGFLGPNGAGKTTTLRMIAGILRPTSGSIQVCGIDIAAKPIAAKSKLGFIPDRPYIYEKLTGMEFLRFVAGLYDQEGPEIEHRARELLALFDLEDWRDELVESYSHGIEKKRVTSADVLTGRESSRTGRSAPAARGPSCAAAPRRERKGWSRSSSD